jgi:hypothetical protein
MPRVEDISYHNIFRDPDFYDEEQREEYVHKRVMDEISQPAIPALPTRQMELDYLEELESEFRTEGWIHLRFRKSHPGPFRRPFYNIRQLKTKERVNYMFSFLIGAALVSPFAVLFGRRLRVSSGGIPKTHLPRLNLYFPIVQPDLHAKRYFYFGFLTVCALGGGIFATYSSHDVLKDEYYTRPDLKPTAPMVEDDEATKKAKAELYV